MSDSVWQDGRWNIWNKNEYHFITYSIRDVFLTDSKGKLFVLNLISNLSLIVYVKKTPLCPGQRVLPWSQREHPGKWHTTAKLIITILFSLSIMVLPWFCSNISNTKLICLMNSNQEACANVRSEITCNSPFYDNNRLMYTTDANDVVENYFFGSSGTCYFNFYIFHLLNIIRLFVDHNLFCIFSYEELFNNIIVMSLLMTCHWGCAS